MLRLRRRQQVGDMFAVTVKRWTVVVQKWRVKGDLLYRQFLIGICYKHAAYLWGESIS